MKVWLIEYHWTEDTDMDPCGRSGDEHRYAQGIWIPSDAGHSSNVLVLRRGNEIPIFHKMRNKKPGMKLWGKFGIECDEWDFAKLKEIEIDSDYVADARHLADQENVLYRAKNVYSVIFASAIKAL